MGIHTLFVMLFSSVVAQWTYKFLGGVDQKGRWRVAGIASLAAFVFDWMLHL